MSQSSMPNMILLPLLVLLGGSRCIQAATFQDDRGIMHEWDNSVPAKVAVRAGIGGLSLYHMGMTEDQLVATWGLWGIRGSNFDPENPSAGSVFPEMDPTVDEASFLASAVNLSPSCWKNPRGCFQVDNVTDLVALQDQFDFVLLIDNGADEKYLEMDAAGLPTIFVDTFYEYNENCRASNFSLIDPSSCYGRSMIDIANRLEELAVFLGSNVDVNMLNQQKQVACEAATALTEAAEQAHTKGIRIKAVVFGIEQDPTTGSSFASLQDFDPIELWVPRTLEELGMPLLHANTYDEEGGTLSSTDYFSSCDPDVFNETCTATTYFPVDFWLIDSRSYQLVDDNFKQIFPDKAILDNQFWYFPRNDGPISYKAIASYLSAVTERIAAAENVQESMDTCTSVDPKSIAHLTADGSGGLELNGFICYDRTLIQEEYLQCPELGTPTDSMPAPNAPTPTLPTPTATAPTTSDDTIPTISGGEGNVGPTPTSSTVTTNGTLYRRLMAIFVSLVIVRLV